MLTRKQFDILEYLAINGAASQRKIAEGTNLSVGIVNKTFKELDACGLVLNGEITAAGLDALEPYRAKRAIFIAAGFGSRMVPVTLNTPKPLVRVNGTRLIDTLIDAVLAAGIEEIYVVRGYLGEQFDQLLYKYPMIKFIENPIYNEANNISSALLAAHLMENAYVMEADLLLYNPKIIKKYQYNSNYLGVKVDKTDDWCLVTDSRGMIKRLGIGGTDCYHLYGVSYWDGEQGAKLSKHIKMVFDSPGGKERYWDQVPLEYYLKEYSVGVRECTFDDITEIDTFNELKKLDKTYDI
ncbi:MAG: NTP transferase domain-containing protein [Acutalibacteraceae bacterium]|nr:NTP transferase domain-containing protein [Acutalibacteraceae bacterium]